MDPISPMKRAFYGFTFLIPAFMTFISPLILLIEFFKTKNPFYLALGSWMGFVIYGISYYVYREWKEFNK